MFFIIRDGPVRVSDTVMCAIFSLPNVSETASKNETRGGEVHFAKVNDYERERGRNVELYFTTICR